MTDWSAIYREADGTLLSVTTVVPSLRAGIASKRITGPPARETWNPDTLTFDPLPPRIPTVDRVAEFIDDVLPTKLPPQREAELRIALIALLGRERFRAHDEPRNLRS